MGFDRYYSGIIIRVVLITLFAMLLAFLTFKTNYIYCIVSTFIVISLQTWNLILFIIKRRNDLKKMLDHIKENNATMYFSQSHNPAFKELSYFLNEIGEIVRQVRMDKENQLRYTEYIVDHVSIGLLSFDRNGKVEFINQAAKKLLSVYNIGTIDILEQAHPGLLNILLTIKPDSQKVFTVKSDGKVLHLAISVSLLKLSEKEIRLVSFQDIKNELDEKEIESWQKLTRVLTHEITNSITPVTSLTGTIANFFKQGSRVINHSEVTDEKIEQAVTGLELIEERGNAVLDFVKNFKSFTTLPTPKYESVNMLVLFEKITLLKKNEILGKEISLNYRVNPESMNIICDRNLMEHVIINLINNAIYAVSENLDSTDKYIAIEATKSINNRSLISITDNGIGIPDNIMEDIFIPFYTTKSDGSGIGLSLSRQILKLHGGTINVKSQKGETVFLIEI